MLARETDLISNDIYTPIVTRIMRVEDTTWGHTKDRYIVRYHGQILGDTESAYDQIAAALKPHQVTPLFRMDEGRQTVVLVEGVLELASFEKFGEYKIAFIEQICGVLASAVAMDKPLTKRILEMEGIQSPPGKILTKLKTENIKRETGNVEE